jgi:hypothetical protein
MNYCKTQIANGKGDFQKEYFFRKKKECSASKRRGKFFLKLLFWLRLEVKQRALFYNTCRFVAVAKFLKWLHHCKFSPLSASALRFPSPVLKWLHHCIKLYHCPVAYDLASRK